MRTRLSTSRARCFVAKAQSYLRRPPLEGFQRQKKIDGKKLSKKKIPLFEEPPKKQKHGENEENSFQPKFEKGKKKVSLI
jgi:hypothetical protein